MLSLGGSRERRQGGDKVENTPAYGFIAVFDKVVHPPYYTPETCHTMTGVDVIKG